MCFVRHIVQHFTRPRVNATETRSRVSSEKFPIGVTDYESKPHLLVLNVYSESLFAVYLFEITSNRCSPKN